MCVFVFLLSFFEEFSNAIFQIFLFLIANELFISVEINLRKYCGGSGDGSGR